MNTKKQELPKLKLSLTLKKETLRPLSDTNIALLDGVVGGTGGGGGGCDMTNCQRTVIQVE